MCVLSGITYSANIHSYYNLVKPFFFFISVSDPQPGILQKYQGKKRDEVDSGKCGSYEQACNGDEDGS